MFQNPRNDPLNKGLENTRDIKNVSNEEQEFFRGMLKDLLEDFPGDTS